MENKAEIKTAESILDETIRKYNSKVSQVYWFQFDKHEKEMFITMMEEYASQQKPEISDLQKELQVTDELLKERQRVLDAIPECKAHGANCVPHAVEWIEETKKEVDKLREASNNLLVAMKDKRLAMDVASDEKIYMAYHELREALNK